MNSRSLLIPALTLVAASAAAQVPTSPAVGSPVSVQSQGGANNRTYSVAVPGAGLPGQQASTSSVMATSGYSRQVPQDFRLVAGDVIAVRVFDQIDYQPTVVIDKNGYVNLPYLGQVLLTGQTIRSAQEMVAAKLVEAGIYNQPIVQIQYLEGPGTDVAVLGEMHGSVPIFSQRPVVDVIDALGGFPTTASHVVTINSPDHAPVTLDLGPDPTLSPLASTPVFPGDTIVVGRAGVIFVVGAFKSPGVIPLSGNQVTTLLELSATTGGPLWQAKYDDLRLIRVVDGKRTLVKLNIDRVLHGKDPDPVLQANDILFLPTSTMKEAISAGGVETVLSVASVALSALAYTRN